MAQKHNRGNSQVSLQKPANPGQVTKKTFVQKDEGKVVTPAEAMILLSEEMVRLVVLTLECKVSDHQLLGHLNTVYVPAFKRLGAEEELSQAESLVRVIRGGSKGQAEAVARRIVDASGVATTVEGSLIGKPTVTTTNQSGTRTVHQRIDCGQNFGTVTAKLIGASSAKVGWKDFVDDFGLVYLAK